MFTVLERETRGMPVEPVRRDLESYDGPRTDLLYAAMSWHWVDPDRRCEVASGLLTDGGTSRSSGDRCSSPTRRCSPTSQQRWGATSTTRRSARPTPTGAPGGAGSTRRSAESGRFTDVQHHRIPRAVVLPQREYVGYLSTLSAYLELGMEERQEMLRRIAEVLPSQVTVDLGVGLHLARRA